MVEEFDLTPKMVVRSRESLRQIESRSILLPVSIEKSSHLPHPIVKEFVQAKAHSHRNGLRQ